MNQPPAPPTLTALVVAGGTVTEIAPGEVADYRGPGFVWLHAEGAAHASRADLPAYVPAMAANALLASETRPRCDEVDDAVLINLRGTAADTMQDSDGLVSIRVWVEGQRVTSVSRHRLGALPKVEAAMLAGRLSDGGDFVAALAQAISKELDPQVADLGDSLDDCEGSLDSGDIYALRRKIAEIDDSLAEQQRFIAGQDQEKRRVHARFDTELSQLRKLWDAQGMSAGSPASLATPLAPSR